MKTALITGCSGDIGMSLCSKFKSEGYKVIGLDIKETVFTMKHCDDFIKMDLSNPDWNLLTNEKVDVLINNAAVQIIDDFFNFDDGDIDKIFNVNLISIVKLTKRINFNKGSNIINIGSIHSTQSKPGFSLYAATKGGLETLTRSLSVELAPDIRVNLIKPAAIRTKMLESGLSKSELLELDKFHPTNKIGSVENISDLAWMIITNDFINGSVISIDGGISNILFDPYFT